VLGPDGIGCARRDEFRVRPDLGQEGGNPPSITAQRAASAPAGRIRGKAPAGAGSTLRGVGGLGGCRQDDNAPSAPSSPAAALAVPIGSVFWQTALMAKTMKARARPPAERNPASAVRLPAELTAAIDRWAVREKVGSRSEAIRHLVELGLASARVTGQRNSESASKASQLAAEQVGKLLDPLLPEEEKRARRHRLVKGPREFRDLRKNQTKPKA
jgi:Arc/MetJ-type ribon-helix-helix transcriptional regulator